MTSTEIRTSFLDFFRGKGHRIVPSAPVIPHDDPTLLFTNAGMNQFKDVFLGTGTREYVRAADTQKCIRVSGKHNDLEEVGRDTYHHTFFEMLGNWSFGDYYKAEAIAWAWELLTEVWKLPAHRLHATVFRDDDEAWRLWHEVTTIDPSHIHRFDEKDNFWEMGDTGPCGPCSEIHIDRSENADCGHLVNAGSPLVMEIWNLVFIQYFRDSDGVLTPLPATHVDTGMGFERICAVLQGKSSNYDTDVFMPIIGRIREVSGIPYRDDEAGTAMRVIADHIRMLTFAIADGAAPGNEGRGYVLRRILRRAARFGRTLDLREPFLWKLVGVLVDTMGAVFPEIVERRALVERIILAEEESFNATLDRGLEIFEDIARQPATIASGAIGGADAFKLYDTFGFPIDLTMLLAGERHLAVDTAAFERLLDGQKERSRQVTRSKLAGSAGRALGADDAAIVIPADAHSAFVGYDAMESDAEIIGLGERDSDLLVVLDRTPFYVESGGQVSDTGSLVIGAEQVPVEGLAKVNGRTVHLLSVADHPRPAIGDRVVARIDGLRRRAIMRNHTATHLAHAALRSILGDHVKQAGSYVDDHHLRFDFSHFAKVDAAQLADIEALVNEVVLDARIVRQHRDIPFEQARSMGALMFFGDKYGDKVNVIEVENFSMEFCGGTHLRNTAEVGLFKIVSETSIASGVRRIEAVTGGNVVAYIERLNERIREGGVRETELLDRLKHLEKELARFSLEQAGARIADIAAAATMIDGVSVVVTRVEADSADQLKSMGDKLREQLRSGVGVLAAVIDDKVSLVCVVTDDVIAGKGLKAGTIVSAFARRLGGGGGGRPHLATAGGKDVAHLDEVLAMAPGIIFGERA